MRRSHIIKLKEIVETLGGSPSPYFGKFFETYPAASVIKQSAPCAALREISSSDTEDRTIDRYQDSLTIREKVRKLYETETVYQIDLYNRDIYAFVNKEETAECHQHELARRIAQIDRYLDENGHAVEVVLRGDGSITDGSLIIENTYKGYCRVSFKDGIYSKEQTPLLPTEIDDYEIDVEVSHGE